SLRWARRASPSADRHAPRPSGPRCASARSSAAAVSAATVPSAETTPAIPHICWSEDSRANLDLVVRLNLVFQLDRQLYALAVDRPLDADASIGAAIGQAAGEHDRLRDRGPDVEHVVAGILDEARDVEPLRLRHVDDVAVLQHDVAPGASQLELFAIHRNRLARWLARLG